MASHNGSEEAPHADAGSPSIPAMPLVRREEVYRGGPKLLVESGVRHSIGWQDDRKVGPTFVVVRLSRFDNVKVTERFPLTEQGWASAWDALSGIDAGAASAVAARLAVRAAKDRAGAALAALNAHSLRALRMVFSRGSSSVPLTKGQAYDVRFLRDRIMVCQPGSVDAKVDMPYQDVETVDVEGPAQDGMSTNGPLALALILGLLGALLGLFILGLLGLVFGGLLFALVGAGIGGAMTKTETTVRIRTKDAELYFLHPEKRPDEVRIALSEPLRAIGMARAAPTGVPDAQAEPASGSISDELSKLASLLQQGLISRGEFDHLKEKLIANS